MRSRRTTPRIARLLVPLLLAAACARSKRPPDVNPSAEVLVAVTNDQSPPAEVTVFIASEGGSRQLLGTVPPTATRTFRYRPVSNTARFELIARVAGEGSIDSQPFTLSGTPAIAWSLRNNVVQLSDEP